MNKPWDKPRLIRFLRWRPLEFEAVFQTWLLSMRRDAWFQAKKLVRATEAERASVEDKLRKDVQGRLDLALEKRVPWGIIFELSAAQPIFNYSGFIFVILMLIIDVTYLPRGWTLVGTLVLLPIVIGTIAVAHFKQMLDSFLPPSLDPPDR